MLPGPVTATCTNHTMFSAPLFVLRPEPHPSRADLLHHDGQHILDSLGDICSQHGVLEGKLARRPDIDRICQWKSGSSAS